MTLLLVKVLLVANLIGLLGLIFHEFFRKGV